jgi:hypothetical protein
MTDDAKAEADRTVHDAALAYAEVVQRGDDPREVWRALLAAVEARRQIYEV